MWPNGAQDSPDGAVGAVDCTAQQGYIYGRKTEFGTACQFKKGGG
jgi:hypothetical protein